MVSELLRKIGWWGISLADGVSTSPTPEVHLRVHFHHLMARLPMEKLRMHYCYSCYSPEQELLNQHGEGDGDEDEKQRDFKLRHGNENELRLGMGCKSKAKKTKVK